MGFWDAVASAEPYANNQHLAPDTPSLNFYVPDALPDAQPTVSKHCKQTLIALISVYWGYGQKPVKRGPSRVVWCVLVYVVLELSTVSLKPSAQKIHMVTHMWHFAHCLCLQIFCWFWTWNFTPLYDIVMSPSASWYLVWYWLACEEFMCF